MISLLITPMHILPSISLKGYRELIILLKETIASDHTHVKNEYTVWPNRTLKKWGHGWCILESLILYTVEKSKNLR